MRRRRYDAPARNPGGAIPIAAPRLARDEEEALFIVRQKNAERRGKRSAEEIYAEQRRKVTLPTLRFMSKPEIE